MLATRKVLPQVKHFKLAHPNCVWSGGAARTETGVHLKNVSEPKREGLEQEMGMLGCFRSPGKESRDRLRRSTDAVPRNSISQKKTASER
jgi:hypothetical protein